MNAEEQANQSTPQTEEQAQPSVGIIEQLAEKARLQEVVQDYGNVKRNENGKPEFNFQSREGESFADRLGRYTEEKRSFDMENYGFDTELLHQDSTMLSGDSVATSREVNSVDENDAIFGDLQKRGLIMGDTHDSILDDIGFYHQTGGDIFKKAIVGFGANLVAGFIDNLLTLDPRELAKTWDDSIDFSKEEKEQSYLKKAASWFRDTAASQRVFKDRTKEDTFFSAVGLANHAQTFGYTAGIILESLAETFVVSLATKGAGTGVVAASKIRSAKTLITAMKSLGKTALRSEVWRRAKAAGLGAYQGLREAHLNAMEAGEQIYNKLISNGYSKEDAARIATEATRENLYTEMVPLMAIQGLQNFALGFNVPSIKGASKAVRKAFTRKAAQEVREEAAGFGVSHIVGLAGGKITGKIKNKFARGLTDWAFHAGSEGVEELFQTGVNKHVTAKYLGREGLDYFRNSQETFFADGDREMLDSFIGGVLGGVIFRGVGSALRYNSRKQLKARQKAMDDLVEKHGKQVEGYMVALAEAEKSGNKDAADLLRAQMGFDGVNAMLQIDVANGNSNAFDTHVSFYEAALEAAESGDPALMAPYEKMGLSAEFIKNNFKGFIEEAYQIREEFAQHLNETGSTDLSMYLTRNQHNKRTLAKMRENRKAALRENREKLGVSESVAEEIDNGMLSILEIQDSINDVLGGRKESQLLESEKQSVAEKRSEQKTKALQALHAIKVSQGENVSYEELEAKHKDSSWLEVLDEVDGKAGDYVSLSLQHGAQEISDNRTYNALEWDFNKWSDPENHAAFRGFRLRQVLFDKNATLRDLLYIQKEFEKEENNPLTASEKEFLEKRIAEKEQQEEQQAEQRAEERKKEIIAEQQSKREQDKIEQEKGTPSAAVANDQQVPSAAQNTAPAQSQPQSQQEAQPVAKAEEAAPAAAQAPVPVHVEQTSSLPSTQVVISTQQAESAAREETQPQAVEESQEASQSEEEANPHAEKVEELRDRHKETLKALDTARKCVRYETTRLNWVKDKLKILQELEDSIAASNKKGKSKLRKMLNRVAVFNYLRKYRGYDMQVAILDFLTKKKKERVRYSEVQSFIEKERAEMNDLLATRERSVEAYEEAQAKLEEFAEKEKQQIEALGGTVEDIMIESESESSAQEAESSEATVSQETAQETEASQEEVAQEEVEEGQEVATESEQETTEEEAQDAATAVEEQVQEAAEVEAASQEDAVVEEAAPTAQVQEETTSSQEVSEDSASAETIPQQVSDPLAKARAELDNARRELDQLNSQIGSFIDSREGLIELIDSLSSKKKALEKEYEGKTDAASKAELQQRLRDLYIEVLSAYNNETHEQTAQKYQEAELSQLESAVADCNKQLNEEFNSLNEQAQQAKDRVNDLEVDLAVLEEEQLNELQDTVSETEEKIEQDAKDLQEIREENEQKAEERKERLEELERENPDGAVPEMQEVSAAQVRKSYENLQERKRIITEEIAQAEKRREMLLNIEKTISEKSKNLFQRLNNKEITQNEYDKEYQAIAKIAMFAYDNLYGFKTRQGWDILTAHSSDINDFIYRTSTSLENAISDNRALLRKVEESIAKHEQVLPALEQHEAQQRQASAAEAAATHREKVEVEGVAEIQEDPANVGRVKGGTVVNTQTQSKEKNTLVDDVNNDDLFGVSDQNTDSTYEGLLGDAIAAASTAESFSRSVAMENRRNSNKPPADIPPTAAPSSEAQDAIDSQASNNGTDNPTGRPASGIDATNEVPLFSIEPTEEELASADNDQRVRILDEELEHALEAAFHHLRQTSDTVTFEDIMRGVQNLNPTEVQRVFSRFYRSWSNLHKRNPQVFPAHTMSELDMRAKLFSPLSALLFAGTRAQDAADEASMKKGNENLQARLNGDTEGLAKTESKQEKVEQKPSRDKWSEVGFDNKAGKTSQTSGKVHYDMGTPRQNALARGEADTDAARGLWLNEDNPYGVNYGDVCSPHQLKPGTTLEMRVPDNYLDISVPLYSREGKFIKTVPFREYASTMRSLRDQGKVNFTDAEIQAMEQDYLPIGLYTDNNVCVGSVKHTFWYNTENVKGTASMSAAQVAEAGRSHTKALRQQFADANSKGESLQVTVTRKQGGTWQNTSGGKLTPLSEAAPNARIGVINSSNRVVTADGIISNDSTIRSSESLRDGSSVGMVVDIREGVSEGEKLVLHCTPGNLSPQSADSVAMATKIFFLYSSVIRSGKGRNVKMSEMLRDLGFKDQEIAQYESLARNVEETMGLNIRTADGFKKYASSFLNAHLDIDLESGTIVKPSEIWASMLDTAQKTSKGEPKFIFKIVNGTVVYGVSNPEKLSPEQRGMFKQWGLNEEGYTVLSIYSISNAVEKLGRDPRFRGMSKADLVQRTMGFLDMKMNRMANFLENVKMDVSMAQLQRNGNVSLFQLGGNGVADARATIDNSMGYEAFLRTAYQTDVVSTSTVDSSGNRVDITLYNPSVGFEVTGSVKARATIYSVNNDSRVTKSDKNVAVEYIARKFFNGEALTLEERKFWTENFHAVARSYQELLKINPNQSKQNLAKLSQDLSHEETALFSFALSYSKTSALAPVQSPEFIQQVYTNTLNLLSEVVGRNENLPLHLSNVLREKNESDRADKAVARTLLHFFGIEFDGSHSTAHNGNLKSVDELLNKFSLRTLSGETVQQLRAELFELLKNNVSISLSQLQISEEDVVSITNVLFQDVLRGLSIANFRELNSVDNNTPFSELARLHDSASSAVGKEISNNTSLLGQLDTNVEVADRTEEFKQKAEARQAAREQAKREEQAKRQSVEAEKTAKRMESRSERLSEGLLDESMKYSMLTSQLEWTPAELSEIAVALGIKPEGYSALYDFLIRNNALIATQGEFTRRSDAVLELLQDGKLTFEQAQEAINEEDDSSVREETQQQEAKNPVLESISERIKVEKQAFESSPNPYLSLEGNERVLTLLNDIFRLVSHMQNTHAGKTLSFLQSMANLLVREGKLTKEQVEFLFLERVNPTVREEGFNAMEISQLANSLGQQLIATHMGNGLEKLSSSQLSRVVEANVALVLQRIAHQVRQQKHAIDQMLRSAELTEAERKSLVNMRNVVENSLSSVLEHSSELVEDLTAKTKEVVSKSLGVKLSESSETQNATAEEVLEEWQVNGEQERNYSKSSIEENHRTSMPLALRTLLSSVQQVSRTGSPMQTAFGQPLYVPFDTVVSAIEEAIGVHANVSANLHESMDRLRAATTRYPYLASVVESLEGYIEAGNMQIPHMFGYQFSKHVLTVKTLQVRKGSNGSISQRTLNANVRNMNEAIVQDWMNGMLVSELFEVAQDGSYVVNVSVAKDILDKLMALSPSKQGGYVFSKETYKQNLVALQTQMARLGIPLSIGTLEQIVQDGLQGRSESMDRNYQALFQTSENSSSLVGGMIYYLQELVKEGDRRGVTHLPFSMKGKTNPVQRNTTRLNAMARVEMNHRGSVRTRSFRDGDKTFNGFTNSMMVHDVHNKIVNEVDEEGNPTTKFLDDLLSLAYNGNSFVLQLLKTLPPEVRQRIAIEHVANNALTTEKTANQENKDFLSMSASERLVYRFGLLHTDPFQQVKDQNGAEMRTETGNLLIRMVRTMFPTLSDKGTALIMNSLGVSLPKSAFNIHEDGTVSLRKPTDENSLDPLSFLYSQTVKPELDRIVSMAKKRKGKGGINIDQYSEASKLFWNFPALNAITVTVKEGLYTKDVSFVELLNTRPDSITPEMTKEFEEKAKEIINTFLLEETERKLKVLEAGGVLTYTQKRSSAKLMLDQKYQEAYAVTQADGRLNQVEAVEATARMLAMELTVNELVGTANQQMMYIGDSALFAKVKGQVKFLVGEEGVAYYNDLARAMDENMGKRLAQLIAPGSRLSNSEDASFRHYNQIVLEDRISISDNFPHMVEVFYGKEERAKAEKLLDELHSPDLDSRREAIIIKELSASYPEIAKYLSNAQTDGQEYTTAKEHVEILYRQGRMDQATYNRISEKLDAQMQWEFKNGGKPLPAKAKEWLLTREELGIVMQPIKPVANGVVIDHEHGVARTVYVKTSSFPLIPQLTAGLELDKMRRMLERTQMKTGRMTRAVYHSGMKVGAPKSRLRVFDRNGRFQANEASIDAAMVVMDRAYFRIQQDVPFESHKNVAIMSQMQKLLFGNGVMSMDGFYYKGQEMSGKELYSRYQQSFNRLIELHTKKLFMELGMNEDGTIPQENFRAFIDKLQSKLIEEAKARGFSDVEIEGLQMDEVWVEGSSVGAQFKIPIFYSPHASVYLNLLQSLVEKGISGIRMPGYAYVTASDAGMKVNDSLGALSSQQQSRVIYLSGFTGELQESGGHQDVKPPYPYSRIDETNRALQAGAVVQIEGQKGEFLVMGIDQESGLVVFIPLGMANRSGSVDLLGCEPSGVKSVRGNYSTVQIKSGNHKGSFVVTDGGIVLRHKDGVLSPESNRETIDFVSDRAQRIMTDADKRAFKKKQRKNHGKLKKVQVLVPSKFRNEHGNLISFFNEDGSPNEKYVYRDEDGKLRFKEDMISPELLSQTFCRIPTSSHSSMTQVEIVGFLPPECGDMVIVPAGMTTKKGLDFDIDKEYSYSLHTRVNRKTGKIVPVDAGVENVESLPLEQQIKAAENDLVRIHSAVLSNPSSDMQRRILRPLSMDFAKSQVKTIAKLKARREAIHSKPSVQSHMSSTHQSDKLHSSKIGRVSIGAYANAVTLSSQMQTLDSNPQVQVKVSDPVYDSSGKLKEKAKYVALDVGFGNIKSDGKIGRENAIPSSENAESRTIAEILDEALNLATDNAKEGALTQLGVNVSTMNAHIAMIHLGFDKAVVDMDGKRQEVSIPFLLLSQPIVQQYCDMMSELRNRVGTSQQYKRSDVMNALLSPYMEILEDMARKNNTKPPEIKDVINNPLLYLQKFPALQKALSPQDLVNHLQGSDSNPKLRKLASLLMFLSMEQVAASLRPAGKMMGLQTKGLGKSVTDFHEIQSIQEQSEDIFADEPKPYKEFNPIGSNTSTHSETYVTGLGGLFQTTKEDGSKEHTPTGRMNQELVKLMSILFEQFIPAGGQEMRTLLTSLLENVNPSILESPYARKQLVEAIYRELPKLVNSLPKIFTGLYGDQDMRTPNQIRAELFMDTSDVILPDGAFVQGNQSLASYLSDLMNGTTDIGRMLSQNNFLAALKFQISKGMVDGKKMPSFIKRANAVGSELDSSAIHDAVRDLYENDYKLPDRNGKPYSTRMLVKDMLAYSLLEGGHQGGYQFINMIPVDVFRDSGYFQMLSLFNNQVSEKFNYLLKATGFGTVEHKAYNVSSFADQFLRHHPEYVQEVRLVGVNGNGNPPLGRNHAEQIHYGHTVFAMDSNGFPNKDELLSFSWTPLSENAVPPPMYVRVVRSDGSFMLFRKSDQGYHRVSQLGVNGMSEYNAGKHDMQSLTHHTPSKSRGIRMEVANKVKTDGTVESIDAAREQLVVGTMTTAEVLSNLLYDLKGLMETRSHVFPQGGGLRGQIALLEFFLKNSSLMHKNGIRVLTTEEFVAKYGEGRNAAYDQEASDIVIPANLMHKSIEVRTKVLLHELVHAETAQAINRYTTTDPSTGKITVRDDAPTGIHELVAMYERAVAVIGLEKIQALRDKMRSGNGTFTVEDAKINYGAVNLHEFAAMVMTEPSFQELLSKEKAEPTGERSILQAIIEAVRNLINQIAGAPRDSVTYKAVESVVSIMKTESYRRSQGFGYDLYDKIMNQGSDSMSLSARRQVGASFIADLVNQHFDDSSSFSRPFSFTHIGEETGIEASEDGVVIQLEENSQPLREFYDVDQTSDRNEKLTFTPNGSSVLRTVAASPAQEMALLQAEVLRKGQANAENQLAKDFQDVDLRDTVNC